MLEPAMNSLLRRLANLKLTAVGLGLLGVGLFLQLRMPATAPWSVAAPLALLAINLACALAVDRRFRDRPALFGFHVCLLLLLSVAYAGQLASLHARVTVVEGSAIDAESIEVVARGPFAPDVAVLESLAQEGFAVAYTAGLNRGITSSRLRLPDGTLVSVGDDIPLRYRGFRLYTTPNKGLAAIVTWIGDDGSRITGSLMFPSYPAQQIMQRLDWNTPVGEPLDMAIGAPIVDHAGDWVLDGDLVADSTLMVRVGDREGIPLVPGGQVRLTGGYLRYDDTRLWMGYRISCIPGLSLLLALALLTVAMMASHLRSTLRTQPQARGLAVPRGAG